MKIYLKLAFVALLSISISACDGFELDSENGASSPEQSFTRAELAYKLLFSSVLLNDSGLSNNREGYLVLFNSTSDLDVIKLRHNDDDDVLLGNYDWTIVNDKLQVIYDNNALCTTTKTAESGLEYTTTNTCENGEPSNSRISNTLHKPLSFDADNLSSNTIYIDYQDNDRRIDFLANDSFEITHLNNDGDDIANTTDVGTYEDLDAFQNVIKLDYSNTSTDEYSLLVLLDGSLNSGTLLQLRYIKSTEALKEVRIYTIEENNRWVVDSIYSDITVDE